MPAIQHLSIDNALLDDFCHRWKIAKLELFGSALRPDFNEVSDIDLLVTFAPESNWGLFEHEGMEQELASLVGRKVDLISRRAVEASRNEIRRSAILDSAISVYEAR
jgi:predicted nucleotidyltransferase